MSLIIEWRGFTIKCNCAFPLLCKLPYINFPRLDPVLHVYVGRDTIPPFHFSLKILILSYMPAKYHAGRESKGEAGQFLFQTRVLLGTFTPILFFIHIIFVV